MQILRIRRGFQADHSSSSYLFYAADKPVSAEGKKIARRYSSRAEIGSRSVSYTKWGDSGLSEGAYKALMAEHYDIMVEESYDWWTFTIAVPQNETTKTLKKQFEDARGYDDMGVEVSKYGPRLAVFIYCALDYSSVPDARSEDNLMEHLAKLLADVRQEIIQGNFSFLKAVVDFYGEYDKEDEALLDEETAPPPLDRKMTKAQLQKECHKRGVEFRVSWTKDQLMEALCQPGGTEKLSRSAKKLLNYLDRI